MNTTTINTATTTNVFATSTENVLLQATTTNTSFNTQEVINCVRDTRSFKETIVTNICTGEVHTIPLGFWDYASIGSLTILMIISSLFLIRYMGK